jgi:POT family proton-dependent oligopeptide transporter
MVLLFFFLTVIIGLMMMIYKELSSQQDKDRFLVLLLSFYGNYFGGAYEQAGGLMNLYTDTKTDRMLLGFEIPTVMFKV